MSAANYRFLSPWVLVKVQERSSNTEKAMEERSEMPIPLIRKNSVVISSPTVEIRFSHSFDQGESQVHGEDEQQADIMAQRLL